MYVLNELSNGIEKTYAYLELLNSSGEKQKELFDAAYNKKKSFYGNAFYIRGVIEISNICKNNCKYCSMRRDSTNLKRYSLSCDTIFKSIDFGLSSGIRSFHISSGENDCYSVEQMCQIIEYIKINGGTTTLVLGKKSIKDLMIYKNAGATTFISKFETSNDWLYNEYNDKNGNLDIRIEYLNQLKKIGYRVGTGNIVGLPYQKDIHLVNDLVLLKKIAPDQASTSRFVANKYSKYSSYSCGDINKTKNFIAIMRLILKDSTIIPTNSSLGIDTKFNALRYGANLISVNLTPEEYYRNYVVYDDNTRFKTDLEKVLQFAELNGMQPIYKY